MNIPIPINSMVYLQGKHPWSGNLARVLTGPTGPYGMHRLRLERDDAADGQEVFAKSEDMILIFGIKA